MAPILCLKTVVTVLFNVLTGAVSECFLRYRVGTLLRLVVVVPCGLTSVFISGRFVCSSRHLVNSVRCVPIRKSCNRVLLRMVTSCLQVRTWQWCRTDLIITLGMPVIAKWRSPLRPVALTIRLTTSRTLIVYCFPCLMVIRRLPVSVRVCITLTSVVLG